MGEKKMKGITVGDKIESFTLADGCEISTKSGRVLNMAEFKGKEGGVDLERMSLSDATNYLMDNFDNAFKGLENRRREDLPTDGNAMTVTALICVYELFGLNVFDMANVLNCTEADIERVRESDAYGEFGHAVMENALKINAKEVNGIMEGFSKVAAMAMVKESLLAEEAKDRITAAKDIMDRSGFRPADIVEYRHKHEGELVIRHIVKDETRERDMPVIDVEVF